MSNMSYIRFENTFGDLEDCYWNWDDDDISEREEKWRKRLLELCESIVQSYRER